MGRPVFLGQNWFFALTAAAIVAVEDAVADYAFPFDLHITVHTSVWLSKMIELLLSTLSSGKQVRTKLAQAFNHWLNVPEDKLQVRNLPFQAFNTQSRPVFVVADGRSKVKWFHVHPEQAIYFVI